jgi:hypothetical protein
MILPPSDIAFRAYNKNLRPVLEPVGPADAAGAGAFYVLLPGGWLGITEPPGAFRRNYGKLRRFFRFFRNYEKRNYETNVVSLRDTLFGRARGHSLTRLLAPTRFPLCPPRPPLPRPTIPRHSRPGLRDGH